MAQTDTMTNTEFEPEPDEVPARINGRRVLRGVAILTVGIVAVLALWQEPLYAGHA